MQAFTSVWTPPAGTLACILRSTERRLDDLRSRRKAIEAAAGRAPSRTPLSAVLRSDAVAVIAEVKRRSPSRGSINERLDAATQARAYVAGGAAAVSVLTEPDHFGGAPWELEEAARAVAVPLLKKDFHIDPVQVVEARALGASALLLIARAMPPLDLACMIRTARDCGVEALVEARTEAELNLAFEVGATLIGINNRDLESLEIDPYTAERLIPLVPSAHVVIAESGVRGVADVWRAAAVGADAVLVGSAVSAAADPSAAVRDLCGVPRTRASRRR